jgi:broad specificity phosphatase PhoE
MSAVITVVLLIRHESRQANEEAVPINCLTDAARKRAFRSGQELAKKGYHITAAYSSPQFRAIETLQYILAGNRAEQGPIPLNGVDEAFGDMFMGAYPYTEYEKRMIIAGAKTAGISPEEYVLTAPEYAAKTAARGKEGANAILRLVEKHPGATIAIASHGGSRIEPIIDCFIPRFNDTPPRIVPPGGTVVLAIKDKDIYCVAYPGNLGLAGS